MRHLQGPQGVEPRKQSFDTVDALCSYVIKSIQEMLRDGYPMAEIAVLYASRTWQTATGKVEIPTILRDALERQGIMVSWVTEDDRAKRRYDITTDSVTLSTIHSVKGMDYAHVFLIGLPAMTASNTEYVKKLSYVGMTRARVGLDVIGLEY